MAIVNLYRRLVKSGAWAIEDVPPRWRDEVRALVDAEGGEQSD